MGESNLKFNFNDDSTQHQYLCFLLGTHFFSSGNAKISGSVKAVMLASMAPLVKTENKYQ